MRFVDPRSPAASAPEAYTVSAPLGPGSTIAMVANGFPDSVTFLEEVERALAQRLPDVEFMRWNKGDASRLASEAEVAEVAERADAVVAAYGH